MVFLIYSRLNLVHWKLPWGNPQIRILSREIPKSLKFLYAGSRCYNHGVSLKMFHFQEQ